LKCHKEKSAKEVKEGWNRKRAQAKEKEPKKKPKKAPSKKRNVLVKLNKKRG